MTTTALTVVGSANVDLTSCVTSFPRPGETVLASRFSKRLGGKGANQAHAAARLTGSARFIGAVGQDADGDFALRQLSKAGVDVSAVVRRSDNTST